MSGQAIGAVYITFQVCFRAGEAKPTMDVNDPTNFLQTVSHNPNEGFVFQDQTFCLYIYIYDEMHINYAAFTTVPFNFCHLPSTEI